MNKYSYILADNYPYKKIMGKNVHKPNVKFSCVAESLLDADKKCKKAGFEPNKLQCQMEFGDKLAYITKLNF